MSLGDKINEIRKDKKISIDELCERSGIPKGTLSKITAGITANPTLETVRAISNALGCSLDDLDDTPGKKKKSPPYSSEACRLAEDYDKKLDGWGKKQVRAVADNEIARCKAETAAKAVPPLEERKVVRFSVPGFSLPMSAGTGEEAGQEYPENYTLVKEPPRGTSYIARVSGRSMEPTYYNGDLVFVHACDEIPVGEIGAFFMDGQQWIKELGERVLISHNPDYAPIPMREDIRCQGRVLGVCDKSYFE